MGMLTKYSGKQRWIDIDWDHVEADYIEAGTPIGGDGQIHNDSDALGILIKAVDREYRTDGEILVHGFCDEADRLAVSGLQLTTECKIALQGIVLVQDGERLPHIAIAVAG